MEIKLPKVVREHTHCKRQVFNHISTAKYKLNLIQDVYHDKCPAIKISYRTISILNDIQKQLEILRCEILASNL